MIEFKNILTLHLRLYPKMQPADAMKLLYQNEFGPEHFVEDSEKSLRYLRAEMEKTPSNPSRPLIIPIGNGLARINLCAMPEHRMTPEFLNEIFVLTARTHKGEKMNFIDKSRIVAWFAERGDCVFSESEFLDFYGKCRDAGFPPVSHSELYRNEYAPAYRVVSESLIPRKYFKT